MGFINGGLVFSVVPCCSRINATAVFSEHENSLKSHLINDFVKCLLQSLAVVAWLEPGMTLRIASSACGGHSSPALAWVSTWWPQIIFGSSYLATYTLIFKWGLMLEKFYFCQDQSLVLLWQKHWDSCAGLVLGRTSGACAPCFFLACSPLLCHTPVPPCHVSAGQTKGPNTLWVG